MTPKFKVGDLLIDTNTHYRPNMKTPNVGLIIGYNRDDSNVHPRYDHSAYKVLEDEKIVDWDAEYVHKHMEKLNDTKA